MALLVRQGLLATTIANPSVFALNKEAASKPLTSFPVCQNAHAAACNTSTGGIIRNTKRRNGGSGEKGRLQVWRAQAASENPNTAEAVPAEWPLPTTSDLSVKQARGAVQRAISDGHKRLTLELLLPLIGATDLDDWPGGIQQQFKAARPLVSGLLVNLLDGLNFSEFGGCKGTIIDAGDAVAVFESEAIALVVFPTGDTIQQIEALAKNKDRPLILFNPQWQPGQVVSDFGFGNRRKQAEELLKSFVPAYSLRQQRLRSEDVKVLRCYPGDWQVYVSQDNGKSECVAVEKERPSYRRTEEILRARVGSKAARGWFERLVGETKFNSDSLKG